MATLAPGGEADEQASSAAAEAERLRSEGYIVFRGVLGGAACDALREHVLVTTDEAMRLGRQDLFGNIQAAEHRRDLKLELCPPVVAALNGLHARCGPMLAEVVGGGPGGARVVELAAITSYVGAAAQPVHADTMHGVTRFLQSDVQLPSATGAAERAADSDDEDAEEDLGSLIQAVATETALIFTALLALQDVGPEMGPTQVWPRTNTVEHHATLWGTHVGGKLSVVEADQAFGIPHRDMLLSKGDLVLYDSRTMHCGGRHGSSEPRSVLCVSCMGPGIRPDGTTWTMLASLRNHLKLADFPLATGAERAPANNVSSGAVHLPAPPDSAESNRWHPSRLEPIAERVRPIPAPADWEAAVQCTLCSRWRPAKAEEAPRLSAREAGFQCPVLGFSCMQEQGYTTQEIDALF